MSLRKVSLCWVSWCCRYKSMFKNNEVVKLYFSQWNDLWNPGNPCWRGWLSTVDFLVLSSLDQVLLILKTSFLFTKQADLRRRSSVLSLSLQLVFPGTTFKFANTLKCITCPRHWYSKSFLRKTYVKIRLAHHCGQQEWHDDSRQW